MDSSSMIMLKFWIQSNFYREDKSHFQFQTNENNKKKYIQSKIYWRKSLENVEKQKQWQNIKAFSYPKVANSVESSVLGETYVWNQGSSK